jgi:hypothetical protein
MVQFTVTVEAPELPELTPPVLTSPGSSGAPGSVVDKLTPTLMWQTAAGADFYAVAVSEYPYGPEHALEWNPQRVVGTSIEVPSGVLEGGEKYRWQMQAGNDEGEWSDLSGLLYFQTSTCTYELSKYDRTFTSVGGSDGFNVTTQTGCTWSASTDSPTWVTVTATGSPGSGKVDYTVGANKTGLTRPAHIYAGDKTFTITQDPEETTCTYELSKYDRTFTSISGSDSFNVATQTGCTWSASTDSPTWVTVTATGSPGSGKVDYTVGANKTGLTRPAHIYAGDKTFTITQDPEETTCTYELSKYDRTFTSIGGSGSFSVFTQDGCTWKATTDSSSWVVVESFGAADGYTVTYTVRANGTGSTRAGHIYVDDKTFTITQSAPSCTYELLPSSTSCGAFGGSDNFTVRPALSSCSWTATTGESWIHITSGASGTGIGRVDYSLDANDSTGAIQRSGSIAVADQTFSITQSAPPPPCPISIAPIVATCVPASGGTGWITVTTNSGCAWSATTSDTWIHITKGAQGVGSAVWWDDVSYQVDPNPGIARTGTITIADKTCTISQSQASGLTPVARLTMSSQGNAAYENGTLRLTMSPGEVVTVQLSAARSSDDTCASGATWNLDGQYNGSGRDVTWTFGRIATYQVRLYVVNSNSTVSEPVDAQIVITGG